MVSVEEDDLAGLEDVSSDGEDDNYEAELTDGETTSSGIQTSGIQTLKRPYKKKGRGRVFFPSWFVSNDSVIRN
jgi:chromodomain-helicase-DNA-binding protein 4